MNKETIICTRGVKVKPAETSDCTVCLSNGCCKHSVHDWVNDLPQPPREYDIIEVQFKNTRKGFFRNVNGINLRRGDVVAVEASPGHDIGVVTLTGWLVDRQMRKFGIPTDSAEMKKVYRKAKPADVEKWLEAIDLENNTMIRSRQIAADLNLNMKIGDVEFQGDRTKAIFYYIADERVDFRELIKLFADEFKVRIEMRQIGARQEAGRIGGIGSCGRELCCSSWISNFISVSTNSARIQEISLNPQKLAGQCGKLKCCLNYEVDSYIDAKKDFPKSNVNLETKEATYFYMKTDIFKRLMWYSTDPNAAVNLVAIPVDRVKDIVEMNRKGEKPFKIDETKVAPSPRMEAALGNAMSEDSITRFDEKRSKKKRNKNKRRKGNAQ